MEGGGGMVVGFSFLGGIGAFNRIPGRGEGAGILGLRVSGLRSRGLGGLGFRVKF